MGMAHSVQFKFLHNVGETFYRAICEGTEHGIIIPFFQNKYHESDQLCCVDR